MTTSATTSATANNQMTVASFKANYKAVSTFNVEHGTDFLTRDECIAFYNEIGEIFPTEQPQSRIETAQTAEVIQTAKDDETAQPQPQDDKKDVPTATPEEVKFADISAQHTAKTLTGIEATHKLCEFLGVNKDAGTEMALCNEAEKAVRQRVKKLAVQYGFAKNDGAASNQLMAYLGKTYTKTGTGTAKKAEKEDVFVSKLTVPQLDQQKIMQFVMVQNFAEVTKLTEAYNAEMVIYNDALKAEKDAYNKAQAEKLSNSVKTFCDGLIKIYGETAQAETLSLINAYFENLAKEKDAKESETTEATSDDEQTL